MSNYGNYGDMTKKVLEKRLDSLYEEQRNYQKKRNEIQSDPDLSNAGKGKKLEELLKTTEATCKRMLINTANDVGKIRMRLEREASSKDVAKTDELTHQLRVSNIIKTLELRGRSMTREELMELVQPVACDTSIKKTLIAAAAAGGRDPLQTECDIKTLFEDGDNRKETIKKFSELEECIRGLWDRLGGIKFDAFAASVLLESKLAHFNETLSVYR